MTTEKTLLFSNPNSNLERNIRTPNTKELPDVLNDKELHTFVDSKLPKILKALKPGKKAECMPFPRDTREKSINLGKGLNYVYGPKPLDSQQDYPEELNPFTLRLKKIEPRGSENERLSWFKSAVVKAENPKEMYKIVSHALSSGVRINGCHEGDWSFAEYVILGTHFHKFKKDDVKKIMSELMLKGGEFYDRLLQNKLIGESYNELYPEVQPKINKQLEELRKVGESSVQKGALVNVEIDNTTNFMEFTEESKVKVKKVLAGRNVLKIGESQIEIRREKEGKIEFNDMSDGSAVVLEITTKIGVLKIKLFHEVKNHNQVQVRVINKEMWNALQERGEEIGEDCVFGGETLRKVVEKGSFERRGMWSEIKEIEGVNTSNLWVNRIFKDNQGISR